MLNPGSYLLDIPTCFNVPGQKPYCPKNYDGNFHGPVSVRQALGNSFNIPAVRSLRIIGVSNFIEQANQMGITPWTDPSNYGFSLNLRGGERPILSFGQAVFLLGNGRV